MVHVITRNETDFDDILSLMVNDCCTFMINETETQSFHNTDCVCINEVDVDGEYTGRHLILKQPRVVIENPCIGLTPGHKIFSARIISFHDSKERMKDNLTGDHFIWHNGIHNEITEENNNEN